ncbi:MAG: Uma2 family endonuclease [Archangium sp.]|nr:Uma2 family endonuclease [Archangium sp.]
MLKQLAKAPSLDWRTIDHVVAMPLGSWRAARAMLKARGDRSGSRMAYSGGVFEIMSPSWNHEFIKTNIARLLEGWALVHGVDLQGAGSWTLESATEEVIVEPDECYLVGVRAGRRVPDLAIEVRWTGGGIEKLPIYAALGVKEVWVWDRGVISAHVLRGSTFVRSARSTLLPSLELGRLAKHASMEDQSKAVRAFLKLKR